jgi:PAS domain S-box-containing protein
LTDESMNSGALLKSFNRLNTRLRKVGAPQEAYDAIADELREVTEADVACVFVIDKRTKHLRAVAYSGLGGDWAERVPQLDFDESFRAALTSSGGDLIARFPTSEDIPPTGRRLAEALGLGDTIVAMIMLEDGPLGYLAVSKKAGKGTFPPETEALIVAVRNGVTLTIENVRTSMELKKTKESTERVLALAPIAIFSCDRNGIFRSVNKEMLRVLGIGSEERLVGTSAFEIPAVVKSGLDGLLLEGMRGHDGEKTDVHLVPKPDRTVYLHVKVTPMWRPEGELEGVLCVAMDVTSKVRLQNQLERSYERLTQTYSELERVNKMKSTFIDIVSHELRTPLTVMRGYIDLLEADLADGHDPKLAMRIATIKANTDRLYNLVESMLDVSRLEKGSIEIHPEPLVLDTVLQAVVEGKRQLAQEKRQALTLEIEGALPVLMADRRRTKDVFEALVDNAIRYTQEGGRIQVGARDEGKLVHVWVKDNGVGIPLENLGRIFERFYIVTSHDLSHQVNRLGLGLPISKGIVEAHGGQLWVESQVGKGSVFHVSFPKGPGK